MKNTRKFMRLLFLTALLVLTTGISVMAQGPSEANFDFTGNVEQAPNGLWFTSPNYTSGGGSNTRISQDSGGPDDFGYTWSDTGPYNWISAAGGTDTGISNSVDHSGAIDIGFEFEFYENKYTKLYVSRHGYLSFNDDNLSDSQSSIPYIGGANDVIAPFWVPIYDMNGYVRYLQGGTAPNRWFVVEWNNMVSNWKEQEADIYTFEAILYEGSNDIVFQYGAMNVNGSYYCMASGIEDRLGVDGFEIIEFCDGWDLESNYASRISRPSPAARLSIYPLNQGRFARVGVMETFEIPIRNTGDTGADVYDLTYNSTSSWVAQLYDNNGRLLTDTDGDGQIDTGSVAQGEIKTIVIKVQPSPMVNIGDYGTGAVTVKSSLNAGKSKVANLQITVPSPFAQVFRDTTNGAMSFYRVQPQAQLLKKVTANEYSGSNPAIAELPGGGFIYTWGNWKSGEIEYTVLNSAGKTTKGVSQLSSHGDSNASSYSTIAVAPNGYIGVVWGHTIWNSNGERNYNLYFSILDASGNVVYGPQNLTNNNKWGEWTDNDVPQYYDPRITVTGDNRFVLVWKRYERKSDGRHYDIQYTIYNTNGTIVKGVTNFVSGVDAYYYAPALTKLNNNRVLLVYNGQDAIRYAVLDSAGNTIKAETSTSREGFDPSAVQLSGGRILLAWTVDWERIVYAVIDGSGYNLVAGPTTLYNPVAFGDEHSVSVTADAANHGILTWTDDQSLNLYYALVDANGSQITGSSIFRSPHKLGKQIYTGYEGYSNTSYTLQTTDGVDTQVSAPALSGAAPGGTTGISVDAGNYGLTTASDVALTATMNSELGYAGAWPEPNKVISGTVRSTSGDRIIVWNLSDLGFSGGGRVKLYATVPQGTLNIGKRYPITFTLTSNGSDAFPENNTFVTEVMSARQIFLPLILKD